MFLLLGTRKSWESHERIPPTTIRDIFTSFLNITTPPSTKILKYFANVCTDEKEKEVLQELITVKDYRPEQEFIVKGLNYNNSNFNFSGSS